MEWEGELRTLSTMAANLCCYLGMLDNSPMIYGTYGMTILYQGLMDGQLVILCSIEELNKFFTKTNLEKVPIFHLLLMKVRWKGRDLKMSWNEFLPLVNC